MRIDRPRWLDITLSTKLEKLRHMAKGEIVDRIELHLVFKSLWSKVVVDWERNRLIFHWKHGGESHVQANMKPLREVANTRRADRPRYQPGQMGPRLPQVKL
jgi:hypothetical protein